MGIEIKVPSVGESITEGNLARWLKKAGDKVRIDEPLFELETEKATQEIPSPGSGRLVILVPEGKTVGIGSVVGKIEESVAETPEAPPDRNGPEAPRPAVAEAAAPGRQEGKVLSPAARRLAEEAGVDLNQVTGTGRGGRITKEDVQAHVEKKDSPEAPVFSVPPGPPAAAPEPRPVGVFQPTAPPLISGEEEKRVRMSAIRQRIAERLVEAQQTAAILTTFNEADLTALLALRAQYKDLFQKKYGVALGFMSFFAKACVEGLKAFPEINARIEGNEIVYPSNYHIGVAVSTDKGLMVPVVRDVDRLTFAQIEQAIGDLAARARAGKITVADLQGGTFTITNGGIFGSLLSTPLLNPPQSGILGMHAIQKRPVAINDQVVVRPMMYLALSYDHRLVDGREAVQFLVRVKECIERPERMMLEV